ncbi:amino acid permease [Yoonia sp. I 8.24]|uniref:APC family permease n=1 Tax=Yoonia sp. I 8.24 TaxID=1537229 RepID=UPI001EDCF30B|nr:amino acid permease [Yoonia sp. I 8.24]
MPPEPNPPTLKRAIGLPLLVLYGLGITIGAGIYVLIGETATVAGVYAPAAFLVAAFVMSFSALSFAEFSGRIPLSAGEALYVDAAFGWSWLTLAVGLSIIFAATISAAAISLGCAGYVAALVSLPEPVIVGAIVVTMGWIAACGVHQSVMFAAILTVIEILGLLVIIAAGYRADPAMLSEMGQVIPPLGDGPAMAAVLGASLIAFFAFIGFDDVVNMVEETKNPNKTMPWAIGISLVSVTVIYFLVMLVAVRAVPEDELIASKAPIGLLFERLTGVSPVTITLVAIVATMNGVVIEIIMAARVAYGLAKRGRLPAKLAQVSPSRRTPLNATVIVTVIVLVAALAVPLDFLVSLTSQIILAVFFMVNVALVHVKRRGDPAPDNIFTVSIIFPIIGAISCLFLLLGPIWIN